MPSAGEAASLWVSHWLADNKKILIITPHKTPPLSSDAVTSQQHSPLPHTLNRALHGPCPSYLGSLSPWHFHLMLEAFHKNSTLKSDPEDFWV